MEDEEYNEPETEQSLHRESIVVSNLISNSARTANDCTILDETLPESPEEEQTPSEEETQREVLIEQISAVK
jgi:hypothetical protein